MLYYQIIVIGMRFIPLFKFMQSPRKKKKKHSNQIFSFLQANDFNIYLEIISSYAL